MVQSSSSLSARGTRSAQSDPSARTQTATSQRSARHFCRGDQRSRDQSKASLSSARRTGERIAERNRSRSSPLPNAGELFVAVRSDAQFEHERRKFTEISSSSKSLAEFEFDQLVGADESTDEFVAETDRTRASNSRTVRRATFP